MSTVIMPLYEELCTVPNSARGQGSDHDIMLEQNSDAYEEAYWMELIQLAEIIFPIRSQVLRFRILFDNYCADFIQFSLFHLNDVFFRARFLGLVFYR